MKIFEREMTTAKKGSKRSSLLLLQASSKRELGQLLTNLGRFFQTLPQLVQSPLIQKIFGDGRALNPDTLNQVGAIVSDAIHKFQELYGDD